MARKVRLVPLAKGNNELKTDFQGCIRELRLRLGLDVLRSRA